MKASLWGYIRRHEDKFTYRLFLVPTLLILFGIALYPIIYSIVISFSDMRITRPQQIVNYSLENYMLLLQSSQFHTIILNTLLLVGGAVLFQFIIGFSIALLMNRSMKGFGVVRTLFILPMVVTPSVGALIWSVIYNPSYGPLAYFLSLLGIQSPEWLTDSGIALVSIIIVDIWQWTPFVMLLLLAGLQSMPQDIYEAAKIDGATSYKAFIYITLPLMKPLIGITLLIRAVDAFKLFEKIYILTGGGPGLATENLMFHAYKEAFNLFRTGRAAAVATILLIIVLSLNIIILKSTQN